MAVVETWKMNWQGRNFQRTTRVNKDGLFRIKLPPGVSDKLGCDVEVVAKTKDEVEKLWRKRLKEFEAASTETRKVILYDVGLNAFIMRGDRCALRADDISFAEGLVVAVWADVFEEHRVTSGDIVKYNYERVKSTLPSSIRSGGRRKTPAVGRTEPAEQLMVWTEEREAFFCRVAEVMETIALRLHEMTNEGADSFAALADAWSGSFLPEVSQRG
jgi:hypothetical protein